MGFPTWTLIGMGVTFFLALIMVLLAYLGQSPGSANKLGLGGARLDLKVKSLTGLALALMLFSLGFFIAGVPLDSGTTETAVIPPTATASQTNEFDTTLTPTAVEIEATTVPLTQTSSITNDISLTPSSGAFGGPPPDQEEDVSPSPENDTVATAIPEETTTATPETPSPTAVSTATATATPTPTLTPTPIDEATAVLDLAGGVVWLYRSPGGQTVVVLQDQEVVILRNGRANRAGIIWQEVSTGDGTVGWVEQQFLTLPEE